MAAIGAVYGQMGSGGYLPSATRPQGSVLAPSMLNPTVPRKAIPSAEALSG
jgi:hypothetical protein